MAIELDGFTIVEPAEFMTSQEADERVVVDHCFRPDASAAGTGSLSDSPKTLRRAMRP